MALRQQAVGARGRALVDAHFSNANLNLAQLITAGLSHATRAGANFTAATLANANLGQAIL